MVSGRGSPEMAGSSWALFSLFAPVPTESLRLRRLARVPVVLTRAEAPRLLATAPPKYALLALLLYRTGLRVMKALRLRVKEGMNVEHPTLNFQR